MQRVSGSKSMQNTRMKPMQPIYALQGASTAPINLHIPGLLLLTARGESQPALGRLRTYVGFSPSALVLSIDPFQLNVA